MKNNQNNKHKHVLFIYSTQGVTSLSLAVVYGLISVFKTVIRPLFNLRHHKGSTSRARALNLSGVFFAVINSALVQLASSTSRARALSLLVAQKIQGLQAGLTSRARLSNRLGVFVNKCVADSTSRARALSQLRTCFGLGRQISSTSRARALSLFGALLITLSILVALPLTTGNSPFTGEASAATSNQLNFQGRLLTSTGGLVPDGTYNMQFDLYYVSTGGTSQWTEDRLNTNTQGVIVKNGYFSVYLGEYDNIPALNWSEDLYLGMTIRGTGSCAWGACTPADAEMTPRFKLTAVPYAFRAANVASSNTTTASTNSDGVSITTGNAAGVTSNSGNITIDTGTATGTTGSITLGATNASALTIGNGSATTTLQGSVALNGAGTALSVTNNATIGGTLGVTGLTTATGGLTVGSGSNFINQGSTLFSSLAISNVAGGGNIGSAATTVDIATTFNVNQTTGGQTLTLPNPTTATAGRIAFVNNVGSTSFTMYGSVIAVGQSNTFIWNGTAWVTTVSLSGSVVNVIGTIDSASGGKSSDGARIEANAIYLQTADATYPGLVSTSSQTFAGAKTFNGAVLASGGLTVGTGQNFVNQGSTLFSGVAISNVAGGGDIGTAATTVDIATTFNVNQTTAGQTLTLDDPTVATSGRIAFVNNVGSVSFEMYGSVIAVGQSNTFIWNGTNWVTTVSLSGSVVNVIGTIDSQTKDADGAVISGNAIYLQTADATNVGLVSTSVQTLAGAKTFSSLLTGNAGLTVNGADVNLNVSSNFNTNINTGSSTGSVYIGNPLTNTVSIDSDNQITLEADGFVDITATAIRFLTGGNGRITTIDRSAAGGTSEDLELRTGSGNGAGSNSGNVVIDTGSSTSGTTGAVTLGSTNASSLILGRAGLTTSNAGALTVTELTTLNGDLTVQAGDTFTFNGDGFTDFTGGGLTNVGGLLTVDATSGTGFFRNGGNSFGGTATLGTNDNNSLVFRTNSTTALTIDTSQNATFASDVTASGSLSLGVPAVSPGAIAIANSTNSFFVSLMANSQTTQTTLISFPDAGANATDTICLLTLANCAGGDVSSALIDNIADALDIQEGTNNYFNINTTNSSENISFGNATTNPSYNFLGSGTLAVAGNQTIGGSLSLFNGSGSSINLLASSQDNGLLIQDSGMTSGITGGGLQLTVGGTSNDPDNASLLAGATTDNTTYTARSTTASGMFFQNGSIQFFANQGLTAGNTFSPSTRLTILESGEVGVGDTSPDYQFTVGSAADQFGVEDGVLYWEGSSSDGFETTLTVVNPTADVNYRLADAAAGTYDICTSVNNCGYISSALTDNIVDAFDLQEGTNNYFNINTTNASENISFGNATTNPSYNFLGSGSLSVAGATTINNTLTVNGGTVTNTGSAQTINVTLGDDGDVDFVSGLSINATSAATGDADGLAGLYIQDLNSPSAIVGESAILIGTGWDVEQTFLDSSARIAITDVLRFTDAGGIPGNDLLTIDVNGTVGDVGVTGTLQVAGLTTLNGGLTVEAGDTFTFNGDAFTDFTGGGLVNTGGVLSVDTTSATGFFRNGGNSFGGTATLGTNDGNSLVLETANIAALTIDASQNATFAGNLNVTNDFYIGSGASATSCSALGFYGAGCNVQIGNYQSNNTATSNAQINFDSVLSVNAPSSSSANYAGISNYAVLNGVNNYTVGVSGIENYVEYNGSATLNQAYGAYNQLQNYGGGTITEAVGTYNLIDNFSAGSVITSAYGTYNYVNNSANTIGTLIGVNNEVQVYSAGSVTTAIGTDNLIDFSSSGTITDAYGVRVQAATDTGAGSITRNAGIAIAEQSAATNNTNLLIGTTTIPAGQFSIYNASTADNVFAGDLRIGSTTAPTVALDVTGNSLISGTLGVATLGTADTSTYLCRNSTNIISGCVASPLTNALTDNIADAFDLQEGTNNYFNINTTNSSENISFGNATTNPSYNFLGSGTLTVAGTSSFNDTLTVAKSITDTGAAQVINVTLGDDANQDQVAGLQINPTSSNGGDFDNFAGISISNITGYANTWEFGVAVGSGYDIDYLVADTDAVFAVGDGGVFNFSAYNGATLDTLLTLTDAGSVGNLGVTGTLTVAGLGTADTSTYLCRNTSNIISGCVSSPLTSALTDNIADALDIQEGTNNYFNINTTNSSENISFGNATTNPSYNFLGSGTLTVAGATTINNNLSVNGTTVLTETLTDSGATQTINVSLGNDADVDDVVGLVVNTTSANTGDVDSIGGIVIENLVSPDASVFEFGLAIGSGFDTQLLFGDTSSVISLADGGVLSLVDDSGSNVLLTVTDAGTVGNVGITGTLQVAGLTTLNGGLTVEAGDNFTFNTDVFTDFTGGGLVNTGGVLSVDTTSATGFFRNGGNDFGGNATLGTNTAGQTLTLETANTARFIVDSAAATLTGQGATTLTSTAALTVSSAAASAISVTTGTTGALTLDTGTTGAINVGTNANAKTITLGNTTGASAVVVNSGTGAITLNGTAPNSLYGAATTINGTLTSSTNTQAGLTVNSTISPSAPFNGAQTGIIAIATTSTSNLNAGSNSSVYGFNGTGIYTGSSTIRVVGGGSVSFANTGTGTIANGYGLLVSNGQNIGGGSVTRSGGLLVNDQTVGTTNVNLLLGDSTTFPGSGNWSIYSNSTYQSALAGNLRIGSTTAPTVALDVTGSGLITQASNTNTLSVVNNSLTTATGTALTTTGVLTTTGNLLTLTANSATTATGVFTLNSTGLTTGYAQNINVNGATSLTTGGALSIVGPTGAANLTGGNGLLRVASAGAFTTTAGVGGLLQVSTATVTGTAASIVGTAAMTTTGNLLTLTANSATTATGLLTVNGTALTTGAGVTINVASTANAISAGGNITFQELTGTRTLGVQTRTTGVAGTALTVQAGQGGAGAGFAGGALTLQGGTAGGTNASGGNINLVGGTGTGTGVKGLVIVDTATFSAATTQAFTGSANITQSNIDSFGSIRISANAAGYTATLSDPTNTTAGRLIYISNVGSFDMTLAANAGAENITLKPNTSATMIWNGADWTAAGASSATDLQAAYDNTSTSAGGAELILNPPGGNADGFTIRNNDTTPITGGLLEVQTSIGSNLFTVNNNAVEYATNGGAETAGGSATTFPANTWDATTGGTVTRYITTGDYVATGQASVSVVTTTTNHGARNRINTTLTSGLTYSVSFAIRGTTSFSTLDVRYSPDGSTSGTTVCATAQTVTTGIWTKITCSFVAGGTITSANSILIRQTDGTGRTFYIDNLSLNVNASVTYAADGSVDNAGSFGTNWTAFGAGSVASRDTVTIYDSNGSARVDTTNNADRGIRNNLSIAPATSTQYLVSFYARSGTGNINDLTVRYSRDGGTDFESCVDYNRQDIVTTEWRKITCLFTTDVTTPTNADLIFTQAGAPGGTRSIYIDALTLTLNTNNSNNVQVGGGNKGGPVTLFTLDRSASTPIASNNDAYLGSMYYDTVSGRIQCYEADGWGACGAAPDNIVNLNPEYAGAVLNGSGVGTMTSDFCGNGGGLSINTTLCAAGEAKNFYKWTSPQATQQTYSIYVTYQLPATFNGFSNDDTVQLAARVDNTTNASVTYEMYKSVGGVLTQCWDNITSETNVITGGGGSANTWYSYGVNGNEATGCGFDSTSANGFVIFKINMKANSNASAYVGTLNFVTTGR